MLNQEDLQAIAQLIAASEERTEARIATSETHMKTLIESEVIPQIKQIADGVIQANDRLDRVEKRLDSLEETVTAHELYIVRQAAQSSHS